MELDAVFEALADRTRLRLLNLLGEQEVCVCFLVEILRESQPNVSRHLARLKKAGLIEARRQGKWMHYRIRTPKSEDLQALLGHIRSVLENDPEMKKERTRLVKFCCATRLPEHLKRAPKPVSLKQPETGSRVRAN